MKSQKKSHVACIVTEKNPLQATVASTRVDRRMCLGFRPCLVITHKSAKLHVKRIASVQLYKHCFV